MNINIKMKIKDRDSVCRLCLCSKGSFLNIFLVNDCFGHLVADAIADLLQVEVTKSDIFPKVICVPCFKKIVEFEDFKTKCLQAKEIFSGECGSIHKAYKDEKKEFVSKGHLTSETATECTSPEKDKNHSRGTPSRLEITSRESLDHLLQLHNYAKTVSTEDDSRDQIGNQRNYHLTRDPETDNSQVFNQNHENPNQTTKIIEASNREIPSDIDDEAEDSVKDLNGVEQNEPNLQLEIETPLSDRTEETIDSFALQIDCRDDEEEEEDGSEYPSDAEDTEDFEEDEEEGLSSCNSTDYSDQDVELDCDLFMEHIKKKSRNDYNRPPLWCTSKEYPLKCEVCGKPFKNKPSLYSHQKIHFKDKPYGCSICGERFVMKEEIIKHRMMHIEEKRHACQTCGKRFAWKHQLQCHSICHSDNRPFLCSICSKGFKTKSVLEDHLRIHRGERPFRCNLCDKSFHQRANLRIHMTVHTKERRHKCDECGKSFSRKYYLLDHKRTHTNERPYVCDVCGKTFNVRGKLRTHMLSVHAPGKYHCCEICGKTFACARYLKNHMMTHSNKPNKPRRRKKEQVVEICEPDLLQYPL